LGFFRGGGLVLTGNVEKRRKTENPRFTKGQRDPSVMSKRPQKGGQGVRNRRGPTWKGRKSWGGGLLKQVRKRKKRKARCMNRKVGECLWLSRCSNREKNVFRGKRIVREKKEKGVGKRRGIEVWGGGVCGFCKSQENTHKKDKEPSGYGGFFWSRPFHGRENSHHSGNWVKRRGEAGEQSRTKTDKIEKGGFAQGAIPEKEGEIGEFNGKGKAGGKSTVRIR